MSVTGFDPRWGTRAYHEDAAAEDSNEDDFPAGEQVSGAVRYIWNRSRAYFLISTFALMMSGIPTASIIKSDVILKVACTIE